MFIVLAIPSKTQSALVVFQLIGQFDEVHFARCCRSTLPRSPVPMKLIGRDASKPATKCACLPIMFEIGNFANHDDQNILG